MTNIIQPGKYQHYKGNFYQVIAIGRNSETTEEMVIYQALYESEFGKNVIWTRPLKEFIEEVEWQGRTVPRYKFIPTTIDNTRLVTILDFLKEIEKLKYVERAIMTSKLDRYENSAEHSWHMGLVLLTLQDQFPGADLSKMLKMVLIHDLVEIYAGDTKPFLPQEKATQISREQEASKRLFSQLPADLNGEFTALFNEFEQQETKEAKIVKSCDKIQAMMQNVLSHGKTWKENKLGLDWIESYNKPKMLHDENFIKIYETLFQEIVEKKLSF